MNEGDPVEILVQGDHIILERYRPRCVFCTTMDSVVEFKDKHICAECLQQVTGK
ncbi:Uncharacterised protein [Chlamydia abortus]|nr:Uncharacterised protein [Chlamydia abortus]